MIVTYNDKFEKKSKYWEEHEVISHIVAEQYENAQIEYATEIQARRTVNALYSYLQRSKIKLRIYQRGANIIISRS